MNNLENLLQEYHMVATNLELSYKNFKAMRELGSKDTELDVIRQALEEQENYLKALLDRINKCCVEQQHESSEFPETDPKSKGFH